MDAWLYFHANTDYLKTNLKQKNDVTYPHPLLPKPAFTYIQILQRRVHKLQEMASHDDTDAPTLDAFEALNQVWLLEFGWFL